MTETADLPWPCSCGRTSTTGCPQCEPEIAALRARVAELEAALVLAQRWMGRMPGVVGAPPERMDEFMEAALAVGKALPGGPVICRALGDGHG